MAMFEKDREEQKAEMQALRNEVKDLRTENKQLRKVMEGAWGTLRQSLADSSVCDRRPRPHEPRALPASTTSIAERIGASRDDLDKAKPAINMMYAATADAILYLQRVTATQCGGCGISWLRNAIDYRLGGGIEEGGVGAGFYGRISSSSSSSSSSSTESLVAMDTRQHARTDCMFFARIPDGSVLVVVSFLSKERDGPRLACCAAGFGWPQVSGERGGGRGGEVLRGLSVRRIHDIDSTYTPTRESNNRITRPVHPFPPPNVLIYSAPFSCFHPPT
jgi:hypothetical protein